MIDCEMCDYEIDVFNKKMLKLRSLQTLQIKRSTASRIYIFYMITKERFTVLSPRLYTAKPHDIILTVTSCKYRNTKL